MERSFAFHRVLAPLIMEVIFLGFFSLVLFLAAPFLPVLGLTLSLFTPLPLILLSIRRGFVGGVMGLLFLTLLLVLSSSPPRAISFLIEFGGMSLLLGECVRRGWRIERAILLTSLLSSAGIFVLFLSHVQRLGIRPADFLNQQIGSRLRELQEVMAKTGLSIDSWEPIGQFLVESFPAFFFLSILLATSLNYFLARFVRGLKDPEAKKKDLPFSSWSISERWVWGFILALALYLLPTPLRRFGLNLSLVFLGLYFIQGLAISCTLLRRWNLFAPLKILIGIILLFQPVFLLLLSAVGLFDVWVDFRRRMMRAAPHDG